MKRRSWKALLSEAAAAAVIVGLMGGSVPVLAESSGEETTESSDETDADDDDSEATELSVGTFTNSYTSDAAYWDPAFTVTLQTTGGTDIAMSEGQFQFVLQEYTSDSYETASGDALSALNTADGEVAFETISYETVGTYYYLAYQVEGTDDEIEYDDMSCEIVVTVTAEDDGSLLASIVYPADSEFNNIIAPDPVSVSLTASVTLTDTAGSGRVMEAGEFSFVLAYADGTIADTAVNDADGAVTFEEITFDEEGTYTYIVYEAAGSDAHITYDDTVKLVVITVAENDAGALSASAVVSVLTA